MSSFVGEPIIAVTGEDDRYHAVRERASNLAAEEGRPVVLYDIDAGGLFASPVPTAWSGGGERELMAEEAGPAERLDPDELETAGRPALADQVRSLRARGIDAWGWLPTGRDLADLAGYAERHHATRVLVPAALEDPGPLDRFLGRDRAADAESRSAVVFEAVSTDNRAAGDRAGR